MPSYSFLDTNATLVGPGGAVAMGAGSGNDEGGITITPTEDINTMNIGADGTVMHSLHANKSGTVTVRLQKTSPVNKQLAQMYALQTASASSHGRNTLSLSNNQTGDTITCQAVAFQKAPELTYAKEAGMNEWTFHAGIIDRTLGDSA